MMRHVYFFANGITHVFDDRGHVEDLEGQLSEVGPRLWNAIRKNREPVVYHAQVRVGDHSLWVESQRTELIPIPDQSAYFAAEARI